MINLLYKLFNFDLSKFDIDLFFVNYILPKMSVFGFFNILFICIILFLFFLYKFIFEYTRIQKISLLKRIAKSALFGFILGLFIYLWSNFTFCDNEINTSLKDNFFNTDLKINLAKIIIGTCVLYGLYKIGSIYYFNLKINRDNYLIERDNYLKYELELKKYKEDLKLYRNEKKEKIESLKNDKYQELLKERELQIENLQTALKTKEKIFTKLNNIYMSNLDQLDYATTLYKQTYIINNVIKEFNANPCFEKDATSRLLWHQALRGIYRRKGRNLKNSQYFELELINFNDINSQSVIKEEMYLLYQTLPNKLKDLYLEGYINSTKTVFKSIDFKNRYTINIQEVERLQNEVFLSLDNLNKSYKLLEANASLINYHFPALNEDFLKNNINYIKKNIEAWDTLISKLIQYKTYVNNIPRTELLSVEVGLTAYFDIHSKDIILNLVKPIKPKLPKYKSIEEIPTIIDYQESYFQGLKFFGLNFGYAVSYLPLALSSKFLGTANPVPYELFIKSIKYFFYFKFFF